MDKIDPMAEVAIKRARPYQFRTFAVGVSFPDGTQEREDELRSTLRLTGSETIKTQAARLVSSSFAASTGKGIDQERPDATLHVDFGTGDVAVTSKPISFYG